MVQIALLVTAALSFLIGFSVFLNNPKSLLFRTYFSVGIVSSIWMIANGITVGSPLHLSGGSLLFVSRIITPAALFTSLTLFMFIKIFQRGTLEKKDIIFSLPTIGVSLFSFTNLNVYLQDGQLTLGALYPIYLATLTLNIILILSMLFSREKEYENSVRRKRQLAYLKVGVLSTILPAVVIGAILPVFSDSTLTNLGPLFSISFLIFVGIAIVRHHLFDIKLVVVRSLAYALSLSALAATFTAATLLVGVIFFRGNDTSPNLTRVIYTLLAVILALIFPSLKHFFDRVTNKLFYRDSYDTQVFLDRFNKILVSTYELDFLLKKSAASIEENVKPTYCLTHINATKTVSAKLIGTLKHPGLSAHDIDLITSCMSKTSQKLIVADGTDKEESLQRLMGEKSISVIAQLSPTKKEKGIGYLLLGPKKSGNIYSSQDLKVIEIVANELVIAVQNALRFEEIENFNITLQGKVDEATKKLRRANEKLRQLDETKDDFISMASHQLRTPLTSVKGYISMVLEGDGGKISHTQREMLGQAFFSSQRMVYLIADLLNVSRLKTGKFVIDATPVNLAEVVKEELGQLEETAASRSLTLIYDQPKKFPDLMLDETKTRQVIMNFVDNAIYYTPGGGHITVHLIDREHTVELRVTDDGIGVPKSEQPHLFTKFYRAGNARKARPDGTGLGLFMAKKVIIAQGGSPIFDSQEGKGSTFGFVFSKTKLLAEKT